MTQHIIRFPNLGQSVKGLVLLLVVGLSASRVSEAQSADIHGTIRDKSGGVIVAARVTLVSANDDKREIVTNGSGVFTSARVAPRTSPPLTVARRPSAVPIDWEQSLSANSSLRATVRTIGSLAARVSLHPT